MRSFVAPALAFLATACATTSSSTTTSTTMAVGATAAPAGGRVACATTPVGITLPDGFCASVFADSLGAARHMVVAPNGDVFVAISNRAQVRGGVIALRDSDHDGRADVQRRFGNGANTGIALANGYLYLDAAPAILRYPLAAGQLEPSGPPDTVVTGLPTGGHGSRTFVIDGNALLVDVGSRTNSCQVADRQLESPGIPDCPERETRAGIWQFDVNRLGQTQATAPRFATGIRNAVAFTRHPTTGALYAVQQGRDQFFQNWPKLYDAKGRLTTSCSTRARSSRRSIAAAPSSPSTGPGTAIRSRRRGTTSSSTAWSMAARPGTSTSSPMGSPATTSSHEARYIGRPVWLRDPTGRSTYRTTRREEFGGSRT